MSDTVGNEQLEKRAADTPAPDPIADRSMSGPLVLFSLILIATLLWALFDEVFGQRPWKSYQSEFVDTYTEHLERIQPDQQKAEQQVRQSEKYVELDNAVKEEEAAARDELTDLNRQVALIDQEISDITEPFQNVRAWIAAKTYDLELAGSESSRAGIRREIEEKKDEKVDVSIRQPDGSVRDDEPTFRQLEARYNELTNEKARLTARTIELLKPQTEARKKRDDYLQSNLTGLSAQQVGGLIDKMDKFDFKIKQIHVQEGDLVDRCESCHLGTREPVNLTAADMGGERAFVSHPNKDLLKIHDPERFGCSTCHGGNGRGTTSVEKAHGRYKHWLWPLHEKENVQAGCNSCHNADRVTAGADVLNDGKELYQSRGCVGCHRYEGFDRESDGLSMARQSIKTLELERDARLKEIREAVQASESDKVSTEEARALLRRSDDLRQMISQLDTRISELDTQSKYLMQDQKKVGPNLKEIKAKLRKEWMPMWLFDPQAFRPGTKMPAFRLNDGEIRAISAFLWQAAIDTKLPPQPAGDAARGKELFRSVGCLACHSIEGTAIDMDSGPVGGDFAANLSRLGEKANYEYIVRWVHNPRQRLAPYSPSLKRDLTPEDYFKKNLPFVFDDQHSASPVDGRQLQVQNMTVMPNFRLSDQDARDIATFLMGQKQREIQYPDASFLDDGSLKSEGERLVKLYGCAGCHEIKGLEEEQRIGTELTPEGSKPIERLDFALLTHDAERGVDPFTGEDREKWYNHKGFFEHKLKDPDIYDTGKEKAPEERLRMPNIYLTDGDITALTTFLLGSVTTSLPTSMQFRPQGQKRQVQDGWWVIQKYNCTGCHNILIGKDSTLMTMPMYQTADGREQLPPRLTTEGARVDPTWLLRFLEDPSLSNARPGGNQPGGNQPGARQIAGLVAHMSGGSGQSPGQSSGQTAGQAVGQPTGPAAAQSGTPPMPGTGLGVQVGAPRNGVRQYLKVRMPTFNFSSNELAALVNFFMGASSQQQPYIPEPLEPLTAEEQGLARALFTSPAAPCLKCHMTGDPAHDVRATAPNFLQARERLKPEWTKRWMLDPQMISPGTSMPSELFEQDPVHQRWVLKGATPPQYQSYEKDHVSLMVRYMFQLSADEQRRLGTGGGAAPAPAAAPTQAAGSAPKTTASSPSAKKGRKAGNRGGVIGAIRAP
ncbi:MAG TPA: c-type cytochrome [Blastocatellia bacterium]|nr:c-type cytochrome [Blastocatellia bacterium]